MDDPAVHSMPIVVPLPAEIDVTNSPEIYERLVAALAPGVDVVIADLTSTSFCDSSGVHAIMHAHELAAARGIRLRLAVSPGGTVPRVLQLTGVDSLMPIYTSLQDAMSAA
jgi:anti-anti-sigma factor